VRVSIGPLELGDLKKGSARRLTPEEKKAVDRALQKRRRDSRPRLSSGAKPRT